MKALRLIVNISTSWPVLAIIALHLSSAAGSPQKNASEQALDYVVYSVFLNEQLADSKKTVLIRDVSFSENGQQFTRDSPFSSVGVNLRGLAEETYYDFVHKSELSVALTKRFKLNTEYVLISDRELKRLFNTACPPGDVLKSCGWYLFNREFPDSGGYWHVSAVGYNETKTQALLEATWACGTLCGKTWLVLLEFRDARWSVRGTQIVRMY